MSIGAFRRFISGFLPIAFLVYLTHSTAGLFQQRSPPRLLPAAACGGLLPPPTERQRRTKPPCPAQHQRFKNLSTSASLPLFVITPALGSCLGFGRQNVGWARDAGSGVRVATARRGRA